LHARLHTGRVFALCQALGNSRASGSIWWGRSSNRVHDHPQLAGVVILPDQRMTRAHEPGT
jgi:hypothetical protein